MYTILKLVSRIAPFVRGGGYWFLINIFGGQCSGIPLVDRGVFIKYPFHKGWKLGKGVRIGPGCYFDIPLGSVLELGNDSKLTKDVVISSANKVVIKSDVLIAEFCSIRDSSHGIVGDCRIRLQPLKIGKITIGNDVWLGKSVSLIGNVTLGDGVVLGVGAFCKDKDIGAGDVLVGVPAKKISQRGG